VGWLRDLILSSPASVRGFDHLAKLCLESASWPVSLSLGHRSLGAMLGKLDREEGLEWLAHRPAVQAELAKALGVDRTLIQGALTPGRAADAGRLVQLAALPFAAGLDLLDEELFPGVPAEVLQPRAWKRLVWVAPSGGGRTLVGRMLRARGLATVTDATRVEDAAWPVKRPLYVELGDARDLDVRALGDGVCVAVTDDFDEPVPDGVAVVRSPPVAELLEPLVAWARARLTAASAWDTASMVAALRPAVTSGVARSAGDVLGLVGLADGVGLEPFTARPLSRLAREWFRRRANERLERSDPTLGWAKTAGYDALVAWVRRAAVDSAEPLSCARTPDAWAALLPADLRRGADLEWLKAALVRAEPSLRKADVERVSEAMPPGAFRIVRAFEALGLLERDGDDAVSLRPHWLVRVALDDALAGIVSGVAFDWGEALLSRRLAPVTLERLYRQATAGELAADELEPEAAEDPVAAAAVEGAVRALGIAALASGDGGAPEPPEALWNEQVRLLVEIEGGVPRPRWDRDPKGAGFGGWLLTRGAWHLAVLALGESLGEGEGRTHAVLRPWQAATAPVQLAPVLDSIASALDAPEVPPVVLEGAVALIVRLRGVLGPLGAGGTAHRLERAAVVADEVALGVLAWASLSALRGDRVSTAGLRYLLGVRKIASETFAAAAFSAFEQAGQPPSDVNVLTEPELFDLLVPHAPPGVLRALLPALLPALARKGSRVGEGALALSDAQWSALLASDAQVPAELFAFVPETAVAAAVKAACRAPDDAALGALWQRFPAILSKLTLDALAPSGPEIGVELERLFCTIPKGVSARITATLDDVDALLRARAASLIALRRHLHRELTRLDPKSEAFRETYALFDELERRCARVLG
jgi:hypothetical protein